MNTTRDVLLGVGIDQLKFGQSRDTVRSLIGAPESTEQSDVLGDGTEIDEMWHYPSRGYSLTFPHSMGFRLQTISSEDRAILLHGRSLVGTTLDAFEALLPDLNLGTGSQESFVGFEELRLRSFEQTGVDFWFEDEVLYQIQWSALWEDENTPKWIVDKDET